MSDELRDVLAKRCAVRRQFDDLGAEPDSYDYAEADELIAAIVAATKKDPRWLEEEGIIEQPTDYSADDGTLRAVWIGQGVNICEMVDDRDLSRYDMVPLYRLHPSEDPSRTGDEEA